MGNVPSVPLSLRRGIARIDLSVDSDEDVAVSSVSLSNAARQMFCFPQESVGVPEKTEYGDYAFHFENALTGNMTEAVYLYEQRNPDLRLSMNLVVAGETKRLESKLPEVIKRNTVYKVIVRKSGMEWRMDVEEWREENTEVDIPYNNRLTVKEMSDLPEGVVLADGGKTVVLPYVATDFKLVIDCNSELELVETKGNSPLKAEMVPQEGMNVLHVRKSLYAPNQEAGNVSLQFRRKGLDMVYVEDQIMLSVSPNPTTVTGLLEFAEDTYTCDFGRYIDNELGVFTLAEGKELTVEYEEGEDPWIRLDRSSNICRVVAGWKPNDRTADGRVQSASLIIKNAADGSAREVYTVKRRNYGLPVTWLHGVWWCKYNARGNSRSFDDQILSSADPAAMSGKSVYDYLAACPAEDFLNLWKWEYQGGSGMGLEVIDDNGKAVLKGYDPQATVHINKLPADALSPDGYELPSMDDFNRVFDSESFVWVMWDGSHSLKTPWEGHSIIKRQQQRRNDIVVGTIAMKDIITIAMSSPDFPQHEPLTIYGAGAQWNTTDGILHSNHYNNILFGVYSPAGEGWYIAGGMGNLYLHKNGAGTKDTRVLRFKKSPVEYIYGYDEGE